MARCEERSIAYGATRLCAAVGRREFEENEQDACGRARFPCRHRELCLSWPVADNELFTSTVAPPSPSLVKGADRSPTPIASKTAFEMDDEMTAAAGSPAPHGFSVGRSIRSITISGTSGKVRMGISRPIETRYHTAIIRNFLFQSAAYYLDGRCPRSVP
jgi:hypothetical protein